ncbi:hypothetical protein JOL79_20830 [Microbispora sp. RL4-1S]|uniref:Uncharacterized protein n=1 Tax=Microbispora oryzae TaxID=2806554 RepID=A0A941ARK8_9ACTN|nr:hypothetical protein [Microbispora oryzae]MBP2706259.1 hypothetical protein [Microbispora oryzae]
MSSIREQIVATPAERIADEASVRAFWSHLNTSMDGDRELRARFGADPAGVLSERGLPRDADEEHGDRSVKPTRYGCTYYRCPD